MSDPNGTTKSSQLTASLFGIPACQLPQSDTDWFPAVDVTETEQEYVAEVDLPGLKPNEVQLRVESDSLCITGQRSPKPPMGTRVRTERPVGAFTRQLPLPADARGEIRATFSDGVLELRMSRAALKSKVAQPRAAGGKPPKL